MKRQSLSQQQLVVNQRDLVRQQGVGFPLIELHESVDKDQMSSIENSLNTHYLTLIVYNYLQTPKMEQFLNVNIETESQLCLVKKSINNQPNKNKTQYLGFAQQQQQADNNNNSHCNHKKPSIDNQFEYYLLYMVNDNIPIEQDQELHSKDIQQKQNLRFSSESNTKNNLQEKQKKVPLKYILTLLVSLADKVVVYELDKQKETFIEKVFIDSVNTSQKINWKTKMHIHRPNRLIFIRQCYGNKKDKPKRTHNQNKSKSTAKTTNYNQNQKQKERQKQTETQKDKSSNNQSKHSKQKNRKNTSIHNEKQTYKSTALTAATSLETLQYYSSLQGYQQYLQQQKKKYLQLCGNYPQRPDHPYIQELIAKNQCLKLISLQQILDIYSQMVNLLSGRKYTKQQLSNNEKINSIFTQPPQSKNKQNPFISNSSQNLLNVNLLEQPWKIRYYIEKVYELQSVNNLYDTLDYEIFHPSCSTDRSSEFIIKEIKKYLTAPSQPSTIVFSQHSLSNLQYIPPFSRQVTLSYQYKQKLLWKLHRLQKYQHQLQEEHKISPQISQDKILYELRDQEIFNWIGKYKNRWMEISMNHLKSYFNKIANEKDHKAIQQFKQECYKMTQKLGKIDIKMYEQSRQVMVRQIQREINSFVDYHFEVLETRRLAGIKYLYNEMKYMLKHKQKVRNKMMLFVLMIVLALMQKNVIAGITIATMAIIVLAIRI